MSPIPAQVGAPKTPQVNLLPPDINQRRNAGRARRLMGALVLVFCLVVAGAWYFALTLKQSAQDDLESEESRTPVKQQELASYSYLPDLKARVDNAVNARAAAGSVDIIWADQLQALFSAFPGSITLESLVISPSTTSSPLTLDGGVFDMPDLGSVTFQGRTTKPIDTAALAERLNALPGYERAWVDAVEVAPDVDGEPVHWNISGAVRLTQYALSGRTETTQVIVPIEEDPADDAADETAGGAATDGEG